MSNVILSFKFDDTKEKPIITDIINNTGENNNICVQHPSVGEYIVLFDPASVTTKSLGVHQYDTIIKIHKHKKLAKRRNKFIKEAKKYAKFYKNVKLIK